MDVRGGKILEYLKENHHLDLEIPDIAFSVKKSEKSVEAALNKLQQKGLVTARKNEYGRVYWYALPSAPITRAFSTDDIKAIKEEIMSVDMDDDDAVDLSELQQQSAAKPAKPAPPVKKRATKQPVAPAQTVSATIPKAEKPVAEPVTFPQKPEPAPSAADGVKEADIFDDPAIKKPMSATLPLLIVVGIISVATLIRGFGVSSGLDAIHKALPKDYASKDDVTALKAELATITEVKNEVVALTAKVDSLTTAVDSLKASLKPPPVKKRVTRRRRRR